MRRGQSRGRTLGVALGLPLLAVVVFLAASPRHRAFYFGERPAGATAPVRLAQAGRGLLPQAAGPAAQPVNLVLASARPRALLPMGDGRVRVGFAETPPARLPVDGVPPGWEVREFTGKADVELVRGDAALAVRLRSEGTSFVIFRDVVVDPRELPLLSWTWNATRLPAGGDVRQPATDDEAAQVYVVFPKWPSFTASEVIGYVWDTTAPPGTRVTSARAPNVKLIVVDSGTANVGTWQRQQRNVLDDYRSLFGGEPPRIGGVAIMIDSNDTRSQAEALVGELFFGPPGR